MDKIIQKMWRIFQVNFGEFIRHERLSKNIGSRELCRAAGVAETYVSQIERGKIKKPDYQIAYKLCLSFNLDPTTIDALLRECGIRPVKKTSSDISNNDKSNESSKLMHWLTDEITELKSKNKINYECINTFIENDLSRSKGVIYNMHKLITNNRHNFDFFCEIFSHDLGSLDDTNKLKILNFIDNLKKTD